MYTDCTKHTGVLQPKNPQLQDGEHTGFCVTRRFITQITRTTRCETLRIPHCKSGTRVSITWAALRDSVIMSKHCCIHSGGTRPMECRRQYILSSASEVYFKLVSRGAYTLVLKVTGLLLRRIFSLILPLMVTVGTDVGTLANSLTTITTETAQESW